MAPEAAQEQGGVAQQRADQKDEVQVLFAHALFLRTDTLEVRHPVVILQHEKANCYHVLEKHFRPEYLAAQERFWRNVRGLWSPALETWRPRVNGVQLKLLQGARLPEAEAEWGALEGALAHLGPYLRADTSPGRLLSELRDFVGLLDMWWANRKRGEGGPNSNKRLGSGPLALPMSKRQSLECMQTSMLGPIFVQPEILPHSLLAPPPMILANGGDSFLNQQAAALTGMPRYHHHHQQHQLVPVGGATSRLRPGGGHPSCPQLLELLDSGELGPGMGSAAGIAANAAEEAVHSAALPTHAVPLHQQQLGLAGRRAHSLDPLDLHAATGGPIAPTSPVPDLGSSGGRAQGDGLLHHAQQQQPQAHHPAPDNSEGREEQAAAAADAMAERHLDRELVTLNVGGHRFRTTAATLAAGGEAGLLWELAQLCECGGAAGQVPPEFFIDRSGKTFEYVLDYLRAVRYGERDSCLPQDERALCLLRREAEFYQLPHLAERAGAELRRLQAAGKRGGGRGLPQVSGGPGSPTCDDCEAASSGGDGEAEGSRKAVLDAVFLETGLQPAGSVASAQAALLQKLNYLLQARQAEGYTIVKQECGAEREGGLRNLFYHVVLRKQL